MSRRRKPETSQLGPGVTKTVHPPRYETGEYEEVAFKLKDEGRVVPEAWAALEKETLGLRGLELIREIARWAAAQLQQKGLPNVARLYYPKDEPSEWISREEAKKRNLFRKNEEGRIVSADDRKYGLCTVEGYLKDIRGGDYDRLSDEAICARLVWLADSLENPAPSENERLHLALEIGAEWQMLRGFMAQDRPRHEAGNNKRGKYKKDPVILQRAVDELREKNPALSLTEARRKAARKCGVSESTMKRRKK